MHFDAEGPWELDVGDFEVVHLGIGAFLVDIFTYGSRGALCRIRLEEEFVLSTSKGDSRRLDLDDWDSLAALFVLRNDVIDSLRMTKTSDLSVRFRSGITICCSPNGGPYEAWEVEAPGGVFVVGRTGEPTIWDGETPCSTFDPEAQIHRAPSRE